MSGHRSRAAAFVISAVLLGALVACGSDAKSIDAATTVTTRPGSPPTTATTVTTPDGILVYPTAPSGDFPPVDDPSRDGSLGAVRVKATRVATFDTPMIVLPRPGTDTLYVAERAGIVRTLTVGADGTGTKGTGKVLDISADVTEEAERGLLGLAFSADGSHLYVSHTNKDGDTRLEDYTMRGDVADPSTMKVLLALDQPYPNHNGGNVVLGPDGKLWFGLGDGGAAEDPANRAQDPKGWFGKLLKIDPAKPNDPEIWALGLRNPWRFSFDRKTGDLWIGDVGQDHWEEVDWVPADTKPGQNFGWSGFEGTWRFKKTRVPKASVPPVFEMEHSDGWCSVTGGVVYRGKAIPKLDGTYLFGDYCKNGLFGIHLTNGKVTDEQALGPEVPTLVSINQDANGEVYLVSLDGGVYRLDAA